MKKSQTINAAEALITAVRSYEGEIPKTTSPVWRQVITETLGIKRLHTARLDRVLETAQGMGLLVEGQTFIMEEDTHRPADTETDLMPGILEKPVRKEVLGRLLEGQLRDKSAKLKKGQAASITFCLCPNCGTELKMSGILESAQLAQHNWLN